MTTQYSPILKLALPVQGELSGTWGDVVNDNITSMVEQAIAGRAVIDTWTTNSHTLTSANGTTSESRCAMLELTDTGTALSGAGTVVCPTASKIYIVKNATGQNITVQTSGGTGILVPDGRTTFLFCDGTNVVEALTHTTSLQLGTSTTVTAVLDEDNMASDSATSLATQQSIKAYVDAQVGANNELSEVLANGNTSGANDIIVDNGQKITVNTIDETTAGSGVTIDTVLLKDDGVNATNLEVTNIKANDGTAAGSIADSTGVVTVASAVLTTADINGGTADGVVIGGSTPAAATVTTATANTSLNIAGTVTVTSILDEDNMASDDPAGLATQQSIKAYVDAQVGTVDTWSEVLANGNTSGATDAVITAGQKITTDTIDETTADAGVTIDSVLLKDDVVNATDIETSTISANDGTTAINIADSTGAVDISSGSLEISGATGQLTLSGATPTVEIGAAGSTNTNLNLRKSSSGTVGINFQRGTNPDTDFRIFMDSSENVNFDWDYSSSIGANRAITFTAEAGANNLLKIDTTGDITFYDGANASFVYDADSGSTFNDNQDARDFTVKSDGNASMLVVDGTNDRVGVGNGSPLVKFQIGDFGSNTSKSGQAALVEGSGFTLNFDTGGNTAGSTHRINFIDRHGAASQGTDGQIGAYIEAARDGSSSNIDLNLGAVNSNGGDAGELMSITANNGIINKTYPVVEMTAPQLIFNRTDRGTDLKKWRLAHSSEHFEIQALNDAETTAYSAMKFERTATGTTKTIVNPDNRNVGDFQVKSANEDDAIFVDAANDTVGFFTTDSAPADSASAEGTAVIGNGQLQVSKNGATPMKVNRIGTDGDLVRFQKNGSAGHFGSIGYLGGDFYVGSSAGSGAALRMDGANDQIYPSTASGSGRDDALNLGASTVRFKNLYLSNAVIQDGVKATTTATTQVAIETFAHADHDGAKVVITAATSADTYVTELLIATNGTTAVATEYGQVGTGSALATYDVDISGADVRILATPASTTSTTFRVAMTLT